MMGLLPNMSANLHFSLLLKYEPSTSFLEAGPCSVGQTHLELMMCPHATLVGEGAC